MSKLRRFEILFTNPEQVYFAGQEVSGRIIIETNEVRKVTDVLFELKGRARTYWSLESGKNSGKNCAGSEPYFCEQFNTGYMKRFPPAEEQGRGRQLPVGTHEIPFSYTLPKSLPTSFEGEFGHVRYTCKATFQRPWDVDVLCRRAFTVIGIEDINDQPDLLAPATASSSSLQRHCFCVRQGSIDVELGVQRSGFTPGDAIQVNGRIHNRSQRPIRSSTLKLVQHVTYRAKTFAGLEHTRSTAKDVVKLEKGEIPAHSHSSTQWDVERMTIPAVPPRLSKCRIIEVRYSLELETRCIYMTLTKRDEADAFEVDKMEKAFAALQSDPECHSLLKKYLDRRTLDKLKLRKTVLGATLFDVIRSGAECHDDPVGVLAADVESYELFKPIFDPIIRELHDLDAVTSDAAATTAPCCDEDAEKLLELDPDYVLSSRVEGRRNIKGYPFATQLWMDDFVIAEAKVKEVLKTLNGTHDKDELKGAYYSIDPDTKRHPEDLGRIPDARLLFDDSDPHLKAGRAFQHWPLARGVYVNDDGKLSIRVNAADHLHFTSTEPGGELRKPYDRLRRVMRLFEREGLHFARDDKLGWLTVSPAHLSSSVHASVQVRLPGLAQKRDELETLCEQGGLQVNPTTKCALPITVGTIPLLSDIVEKALKNGRKHEADSDAAPPLISPTSTTSGEDAVVQVTITDESGRTGEMSLADGNAGKIEDGTMLAQAELDESLTVVLCKKRVRMPSSILSELYPSLPSPYYRESCSGRVNISDEKESCEYGESLFAPKYPFYND